MTAPFDLPRQYADLMAERIVAGGPLPSVGAPKMVAATANLGEMPVATSPISKYSF
jgi:hypothetical protein